MRTLIACLSVLLLISCDERAGQPEKLKQRESIIRNLPLEDREYLLEPLEGALDDLRKIIDNDASLFSSSTAIESDGRVGELRFKLDGKDTVLVDKTWKSDDLMRHRTKYWDKNGNLFYTELRMAYFGKDGAPIDQRAYRMYLEEGLTPIFTYGKASFNKVALPETWQTVCPTAEELQMIKGTATK